MKREMIITLEAADAANPQRLFDAFNLVSGMSHLASTATRLSEEVQRAIRRIRGNQFTFEDAELAVGWLKFRSRDVDRTCDTETLFGDPKQQELFVQGVRSNAAHAARLADEFLADLLADILALNGS